MTRLRLPLSVIVSSAIATVTLLGSTFTTQACVFQNGSLQPGGMTRQANVVNQPLGRAPGDSRRQMLLDYGDVASFGAFVGLCAIAIRYKARHSRAVASGEAEFLSNDPQLEHPEMALAIIPKEAFSSTFDLDFL